jgi:hypothetical protein
MHCQPASGGGARSVRQPELLRPRHRAPELLSASASAPLGQKPRAAGGHTASERRAERLRPRLLLLRTAGTQSKAFDHVGGRLRSSRYARPFVVGEANLPMRAVPRTAR